MTYPLRNRNFVSGRWLAVMMLGWVGLIAACSSEGTTTILENGQTLSIDLPDVLTRAVDNGTLEAPNLRPVVTLSNGATVGTTLVDDNRWSGTINLEIDAVYTVTVTWIERYLDQDLPLTRRSLDLAVGGDGSAEEVAGSRTDYSDQGLDFDSDGASNLEERLGGGDPLQGEAIDNPATGEEPVNEQPVEGGIDVSPTVPVSLPDALIPALLSGALSINDLRPVVTVSNGDTVDMTPVGNNDWTGTFNVTTAGVYTITTIWVEDYLGMDLSLARRTVDLAIGEDSSVVQSAATGYDIDFDDDDDGPSNLSERINGTDPLTNDAQAPAVELVDALDGTQNSDTQNFQATLNDSLSDQDTAASNAATDTGASTLTENGQAADTTTTLRVTADVIVPRISSSDAPRIDGLNVTADSQNRLTGEWAQAVQSDISGATLAIDHLMIDIDAETGGNVPYRRWAAMHDGRYLYVVVLVDDDGYRVRDSGAALYDDDSLELYLDADNSKSTSYDNNDFHRLFPLRAPGGNENSKVSVNSGDVPGPNSSATPLFIDFATGPGVGPDGLRRANYEQDVYELRIPLQSAGVSSDMPFGFELQVNDDDDGLARDAKWGWMHPVRTTSDIDETVLNPSLMGTLMLE